MNLIEGVQGVAGDIGLNQENRAKMYATEEANIGPVAGTNTPNLPHINGGVRGYGSVP